MVGFEITPDLVITERDLQSPSRHNFMKRLKELEESTREALGEAQNERQNAAYWGSVIPGGIETGKAGYNLANKAAVAKGGKASLAGGAKGGVLGLMGYWLYKHFSYAFGEGKRLSKLNHAEYEKLAKDFTRIKESIVNEFGVYDSKRNQIRESTRAAEEQLKISSEINTLTRGRQLNAQRLNLSKASQNLQLYREQRKLRFKEYQDRTDYLNSVYYAKAKALAEKEVLNASYIDSAVNMLSTSLVLTGKKRQAIGQGYVAALEQGKDYTKSSTSRANTLIANALRISAEVYNAAHQLEVQRTSAINNYNSQILKSREVSIDLERSKKLNRLTTTSGLKDANNKFVGQLLQLSNLIKKTIASSAYYKAEISTIEDLLNLETDRDQLKIKSLQRNLKLQLDSLTFSEKQFLNKTFAGIEELTHSFKTKGYEAAEGLSQVVDQSIDKSLTYGLSLYEKRLDDKIKANEAREAYLRGEHSTNPQENIDTVDMIKEELLIENQGY